MAKRTATRENQRSDLYGPMLIVKDIEASVRFYRDRIGLKGESTGPWAEFSSSKGNHLVLLESSFWSQATGLRPETGSASRAGGPVISIQVANVVDLHRRIADAGIPVELPPTEVPQMGNRIAIVRDPDGHLVELATMLTKEDFERMKAMR